MFPRESAPMPDRPRRLLWTLFAAALAGGAVASRADAADGWAALPSYFSHHAPPHLAAYHPTPVPRTAYRPAAVGDAPGFALQGVTRVNRVLIGGTTGGVDATVFYGRRVGYGP